MSPPNDYSGSIASVLTKISGNNMRLGFEFQFASTQRTVGKRINSEIDTVIRNDTTPKRLATLERDYAKLETNKGLIDKFKFDMQSNVLRLQDIKTKVASAISAFSSVDADTNLTTAEVTAINEQRDALVKDISALLLTVHPDIANPFVVRDVKNMYETVKAMDPVVGTVDPAGTAVPTNGNRAILDDLTSLSSLVDTAYNVSDTALENASQMSLNISAGLIDKLTDMTSISEVELARRQGEIDDIKAKYANILRTISISYESRLTNIEKMSSALNGWDVQPGSVMNLFA